MTFLPNQLELQSTFSGFLFETGLSAVSVKNYVSDLRHFFSFCASNDSVDDLPSVQEVFQNISKYLNLYIIDQKKNFTPQNTVNRRLASIRRFSTFLASKFGLSSSLLEPTRTSKSSPVTGNSQENSDDESLPTIARILEHFKSFLVKEKKTHSTVKNYISDLNHFFAWSANETPFLDQKLENILSENHLNTYVTYLRLSHTSTSVINRRQSSIKQFTRYCFLQKYIPLNPFEYKREVPRLTPFSWLERLTTRKNNAPRNRPKGRLATLYQKYNSLPFTPYLHLAILALATSAMVVFGYNQIIKQASPSSAALPTVPRRQLSFQGRLTDSSGTPITTDVDVVFKLWNGFTTGSELYTSGTCSITADQNGIFNTLIGGGTCGTEITNTVFTENRDVYLEVTVGTETLTPRQQIATVGYALNSETLQGYPASSSATINTVPIVDNNGDINIQADSPTINSTSGTFSLSGQALTLSTAANSGGDIVLQPDAIGAGQVQVLGSTTDTDTLRIENANLTSGSLISGYIGNNTSTGRLLSLTGGSSETDRFYVAASGQTKVNTLATLANAALIANQNGTGDIFTASASGNTKFTIGNTGNISATGTLTGLSGLTVASGTVSLPTGEINNAEISELDWTKLQNYPASCPAGQAIQQVGDTLTCIDISAASGNLWQLNAGAVTPLNISNALTLGNAASASAIVSLPGTTGSDAFFNLGTGNFGIGLTNPGSKLTVLGTTSVSGGQIDLNASSNFATNINTGTSTGAVTIGGGTATQTVAINSADWDITTTGDMSNIGAIGMNGAITGATGFNGLVVTANTGDITTGTWSGTAIAADHGGTGQTVYAVGDLLYASTTTALSKLADIATGNVLLSGGVGVAPSWGKVGLTTAVTGVLPLANGGTNKNMSVTNGGVVWTDADSMEVSAAGTSGQYLVSNGAAAPSWTSTVGATSVPFSGITSGTNVAAAMVVGAGASLDYTSTGTINASSLAGATWTSPGTIGSIAPNSGAFTTLTSTGVTTLGNDSATVAINSSDWDINVTGDMTGIGAVTMNGLLTGSLGANITGAVVNLNASSNFATNINTGTSTGAVTIGGNANTVAINSSNWDINTSGAASGFTGIASSGNIDFSSLTVGGLVKAAVTTGRLSIASAGSDYEVPLTFSNGLTRTVNAVKLGGTLTANTEIPLAGFNLAFSGTGNVGIGTTNPGTPLTVATDGSNNGIRVWRNANMANGGYQGLLLALNNSAGTVTDYASIVPNIISNTAGAETGRLSFYTRDAGALGERVTILNNGNVGIGLTNPSYDLDVVGDVNISGNYYVNGVLSSGSNWVRTLGSIAPKYITDSLNLGATATTSALVHLAGTPAENSWINTGNVGIGTTTPGAKLDVYGVAWARTVDAGVGLQENLRLGQMQDDYNSPLYTVSTGDFADQITVASKRYNSLVNFDRNSPTGQHTFASLYSVNGGQSSLTLNHGDSSTDARVYLTTNGNSYLNGGNVGIGLTNPDALLDILSTTTTGEMVQIVNTGVKTAGSMLSVVGNSATTVTNGLVNITGNALTTGKLLSLNSSSAAMTGTLMDINLTGTNAANTGTLLKISSSGALSTGTPLMITNLSAGNSFRVNDATGDGDVTPFIIDASGNVGIGVTNPSTKLVVAGNIYPSSNDSYSLGSTALSWIGAYIYQLFNSSFGTMVMDLDELTLNGGDWRIPDGGLSVGTTSYPASPLVFYVEGDGMINGNLDVGTTSSDTVTVGGGAGKLNVGTVDPPYTINGIKYATYMASMVGIKEETVGNVTTIEDQYIEGLGYRTLIDLDQQPVGSDIWLFSQTTKIIDHINNLSVLLTPEGQAKAWYEVDKPNKILAIYSSTPTTISYRLTAPRFDAENWSNLRNSNAIGHVINNTTVYENQNSIFENPVTSPELIAKIDGSGSYQLMINGTENKEVSSFMKSIIANLRVGVAVMNDLFAENLNVTGKLVSPIADIGELNALNATISGTLYADNIKSSTLDSLDSQINLLSEKYSTASGILAELQAKYSTYDSLLGATSSAEVSGDPLALSPLATTSATIPSDLALNSLNVHTLITNDLLANGVIFTKSISAFDSDLYIQPTGDKLVYISNNLMVLYPDGKIVINGDLLIKGNIVAEGLDTKTATVSGILAVGSSKIASESANFNQLTTNGLVIASGNDSQATISGQTNTNATIGTATLADNTNEISILNRKITPKTLIYITPTSDTGGRVLFVKSKNEGVGFSVGITGNNNAPLTTFNYWLVETI